MKTVLSFSLAAASLIASVTLASAADTQVAVSTGPVGVSLRSSMLSPSPVQPKFATAKSDTAPVRNVRIVLQSPYGK